MSHLLESNKKRTWRDSLESILVAIFLALVVRTFVFSAYRVPTSSMAPTLVPGDFILTYKLPFGVKVPFSTVKLGRTKTERGELVVFTYGDRPRTSYIKRVIAVEGDRVEIRNGELFLNESLIKQEVYESIDLSQVSDPRYFSAFLERAPEGERIILRKNGEFAQNFGPIVVPPNEVFLLGDHRDASDDSRYWGTVPIDRLEGKAVLIWLSLKWQTPALGTRLPAVRWERLFKPL